MKILATMGYQLPGSPEAWHFVRAALVLIDWERKRILKQLHYETPVERMDMPYRQRFTGGELLGREMLVTSWSEILSVDLDAWEVTKVVTHPSFNDLHHAIRDDGALYVANTGLQCVHKITEEGELLATLSTSEIEPWEQYDPSRDYRRVNTKPHAVHPNHLFHVDGRLWVTRFRRNDAVRLDDHARRMNIELGMPHDGIPDGDLVYFTTTNGHVVATDAATGERRLAIDLNAIDRRKCQLGWCRGLCLLGDGRAFVGFTAFRPSRWKDAAHWIMQDGKTRLPSRIALYDLRSRQLLEEMAFTRELEGAAVHNIWAVPD